jgi:hypothetical protein
MRWQQISGQGEFSFATVIHSDPFQFIAVKIGAVEADFTAGSQPSDEIFTNCVVRVDFHLKREFTLTPIPVAHPSDLVE